MYQETDCEAMGPAPALAPGEWILWRGKPKKCAYIADKTLAMLPIAVLWAVIDIPILSRELSARDSVGILFMAVHLLPVWIWLGNTLTSVIQWRSEEYYLTNKRIIIRRGIFNPGRESVFLRDVHTLRVHYGLLDRMFGSGDIYINYAVHRHGKHRSASGWFLMNLADPEPLRERIELLALENGGAGRSEAFYY